jgi:hypothetical protein
MAPCALRSARVAEHDVAQPLLEILHRRGEAEDRHHLGSDHDVEAVLPRVAVGRTAQRYDDVAQRPVVHVHHPLPRDAARVDAELVALGDVVVDHRRQQVVRESDGVEIAREVEVDVLHGHDLRVAAAGRAALHAEHGTEARLAQADDRLLADVIETVPQAHGGRRLPLAGGRRAHGGDQDELPVRLALQAVDVFQGYLGLVVAVGLQVLLGDAELRGHLDHALHLRLLGDFDVGQWHVAFLS